MEGSENYRVPKLKGSENYDSWKEDITSALKAKGLWMITSEWLKKPEAPESNSSTAAASVVLTAARKEYATAAHYWADKNDRACDMITYNCEKGPRVHISKINDSTKMWSILETHYEQSDLTTLYLATKELNRSKQSDFNSIQDYADSLKRAATKCSNAGKTVEPWLLSNLFLLGLNESLEPYIFGLIQSAKANKSDLLIGEMAIALADHDKRANEEEDSSSKSMVAQFGGKKSKFRSNSKTRKVCSHCEQKDHDQQNCWHLHSKLRSERKDLTEEDDFGTTEAKIVRTLKVSIACRAGSHTDV